MSTDYSSISQSGVDGYGNGSEGYGEGYNGSLFGGDPARPPISTAPGGGGVSAPIQFGGGGMTAGQGIPGRRDNRATGNASQAQSLKPMISQMLGLGPQQMQGQRRGLGGNRPGMGGNRDPRMRPPIMRGQPVQGRPILGGPRPMPVAPIQGAPGGGTMRGGQGGQMTPPIQRGRMQAQPGRQGQI